MVYSQLRFSRILIQCIVVDMGAPFISLQDHPPGFGGLWKGRYGWILVVCGTHLKWAQ